MATKGIPVLNYHAIYNAPQNLQRNVSVSLECFREHIGWLRDEGYASLTKEELNALLFEKKPVPDKRIMITFDDGYHSIYEHALPILSAFNFTATLFLSTSFIGKKYEQIDFAFVRDDRQLTWPEIKELVAHGWDVQSHGYIHHRLTELSPENVANEVNISKDIIEQNLGYAVDSFAFPYGRYNKAVIDQVVASGYTSAYTVHSGKLFPSAKNFQLPRIQINNMDTQDSFQTKILTGYASTLTGMRAKIRDIAYSTPEMKDRIEKLLEKLNYSNL
jgi:peptidoglycan/xylan/chitin deacetylase (PgdA/CDA1 family)